MRRPKMTSLQAILFLVAGIVNNIALSSPQVAQRAGPPLLTTVPETGFSCIGRPAGYYSDLDADCQVYHMCDISQKKASFLCPGYTLFNQKYMVCDHWHAVDCASALDYYDLNLQIGQVPGNENEIVDEGPQKLKVASRKSSISKETTTFKPFDRIVTTTQKTITSTSIQSHEVFNSSFIVPEIIRDFRRTTTARPISRATTARPVSRATTRRLITTPPQTQPSFFTTKPQRRQLQQLKPVEFQFISGRGSGRRVKFTKNNLDSDEDTTFKKVKLRPLFKNSLFDKRNFTVSNEIFTTTPIPEIINDSSFEDAPPRSREIGVISTFLVPPLDNSGLISSPNRAAIVSPFTVHLPLKSPVILHGENQEIFTPLTLSTRIEPPKRDNFLKSPLPRITPPQFPFQRGNRDFFIPSPGLTPPLATNDLEGPAINRNKDHDSHRMTMTFPSPGSFRRGRPFNIHLNPECPMCHPAFLVNGCQPCVIIKR